MEWGLRRMFHKGACSQVAHKLVFQWIPDSSHNASGSRNNFQFGVLGDDFGE